MRCAHQPVRGPALARAAATACAVCMLAASSHAAGETLDAVANAIAWVSLILTPVILIGLNWYVNIQPERIARKRRHPQLPAIKALITMSSLFGGLLGPIAWISASSKPVMHKLAYGTDVDEDLAPAPDKKDKELEELRSTITELRAQLRSSGQQSGTN